ncbi:tRNA-(ms[2]io[6]A)-hydroxylase [Acanthopleuribacter pedis]|uniref:tRNA-(Ms[2]io[6]A)-hydroxylase n=1 Tax=Acanthopleuribacter pedis TaxID=442870 RepID=A0A8J7QIZ0_9BACT|nr:tRNA-(ms[2]io[6]A)-hydroxylase [Acanthopleuribacter pedis]MBO1319088.1 tRNA-(ms[2]io[6]A)-hydroxylase [Acanthopleuribacter pedis]
MTGEATLLEKTPDSWIEAVLADFSSFLLDHAAAERKASAMAVSFVVQYPDRFELHTPMIRLAREELLHYQQVMSLIHKRNLVWERDVKDPYVAALRDLIRTQREKRLLDRLLVGSVIEARGVERFGLVGEHVPDPDLARFYARLAKSEANHADLFTRLARKYFASAEIQERLAWWRAREAEAMLAVPPRAALH